MMLCGAAISCRSSTYEHHVPMHVLRESYQYKPQIDAKTLATFVAWGFGSGFICQRLDCFDNMLLKIFYLYLWGQAEESCVEHALYELSQQGVNVSPTMTKDLFWIASWLGYFTSASQH